MISRDDGGMGGGGGCFVNLRKIYSMGVGVLCKFKKNISGYHLFKLNV